MRALVILFSITLLSGCATQIMSEKQCLAGDWYNAGLQDGADGRRDVALSERASICAEVGVRPDRNAYFAGREEGLAQLCTGAGGFAYGRKGQSYLGVCEASAERSFLGGYLEGWRIYRVTDRRDQAQNAYDTANRAIDRHKDTIASNRQVVRSDDVTDEEREKARKRLRRARANLESAEQDAEDGLYELGRADEALAQTIDGMGAWRQSENFKFMRDELLEVHNFARAEPGIDYCTDEPDQPEFNYNRPYCYLNETAVLSDRVSGEVCVTGAGRALRFRRGYWAGFYQDFNYPSGIAEYLQTFNVYPIDDPNVTARSDFARFVALFDENRAYLGVVCPPSPSSQ